MVKVSIYESEEHRLSCMQMCLMELLSSNIITLEEYDKFKLRILKRLYSIPVKESEVKNGKNEKNAECGKQNIISKECK